MNIKMVQNMKVSGEMINKMEKELLSFKMVQTIKENTRKETNMEKVLFF